MWAFYRMVLAGGALAAVSFYVCGTGLAFGLGSFYSTVTSDPVYMAMFGADQQSRYFATINLMNSVSVLIALACVYLMCGTRYVGSPHQGLRDIINALQILRRPLLALAGITLFLQFLFFPIPEDLLLRNLLDKLSMVVPLAIVLTFSSWRKLPILDKCLGLILVSTGVGFGLLSASKTAALFPLVATIAGFLLDERKVVCTVLTLIILFFYSSLATIVSAERAHWQYDPVTNSVSQRLDILMDALAAEVPGASRSGAEEEVDPLKRLSHAPYQAFLVNEWNEGRPGNSLQDSWTALIPRVLWPEKPIITRFGAELYATIFRVDQAASNQAPTYSAEAFWNYGWVGLVVVSILLGLQIGWFSRKWLELSFGRSMNLGILIFALPVILNSWAVETWIAASYVGGFVTLLLLIKAADWATSFFVALPDRRSAHTPRKPPRQSNLPCAMPRKAA